MTHIHVHAVLQTVVPVKQFAAAVAILQRLRGFTLFPSSACCCQCLVLCETFACESSLCRWWVHPSNGWVPPMGASITTLHNLTKVLQALLVHTSQFTSHLVKSCLLGKCSSAKILPCENFALWKIPATQYYMCIILEVRTDHLVCWHEWHEPVVWQLFVRVRQEQ